MDSRYEVRKSKKDLPYSFFGKSNGRQAINEAKQSVRVCRVCSKPHGAWVCPDLNRWIYIAGRSVLSSVNCVSVV